MIAILCLIQPRPRLGNRTVGEFHLREQIGHTRHSKWIRRLTRAEERLCHIKVYAGHGQFACANTLYPQGYLQPVDSRIAVQQKSLEELVQFAPVTKNGAGQFDLLLALAGPVLLYGLDKPFQDCGPAGSCFARFALSMRDQGRDRKASWYACSLC